MPRPRRLLRALAVVASLGLALTAPLAPVHAADTSSVATPLVPTIDSLTPGALSWKARPGATITVTGTVTNTDSETWHGVRIYPFIGNSVITTASELDEAALTDADALVGHRIYQDLSATDLVGDIAPGQSVPYTIVVPRSDLGVDQAGVYWFGVHALGSSADQPPDNNADGRARTFLPLLPQHKPTSRPVRLGMLLQLRHEISYAADGSISDPETWTHDLTKGRLGSLLTLGSTNAGVTWLVDPAVLDAVRRLAAGNPPRDLSDNVTTAPAASSTASPSTAPTPTAAPTTASETPVVAAAKAAAKTWLDRFLQVVKGHQVLALPYGDPDLPATAAWDASLYSQARTQGDAVLKSLGIPNADPVAAPATGYLDQATLSMVGDSTLTIAGSQAFHGRVPGSVSIGGHTVTVTSSATAAGGPTPGDPLSGVALRQRILSEAALLVGTHKPLLVTLPDDIRAGAMTSGFLDAFQKPWLSLIPFTAATPSTTRTIATSRLVYPTTDAISQISPEIFSTVDQLIAAGKTLDQLLPEHVGVAEEVLDEALTSTSYAARDSTGYPATAALQDIQGTLGGVRLEPPTAVTLSSATGRFSVTVTNTLSHTVEVQLQPTTDKGITVKVPDAVRIAPGDSASVLVSADVHTPGVHQIGLRLTDPTGTPIGSQATFPLRSAQVSRVIWLFIGAGVGILFLAIAIRLVRRIGRRTEDPEKPEKEA